MKVTFDWYLNNVIDCYAGITVDLYESNGTEEKILKENFDRLYSNAEEYQNLKKREIYFITFRNNNVEVYLRPEGWNRK